MPRALKVCPVAGCPELVASGRCETHTREAERSRGSASARGYDHQHRVRFRQGVLLKHPTCRCPGGQCDHHAGPCWQPSKHADHYPRGRDELKALGLNANDPQYGRGLCAPCHSVHTAHTQPGGWNAR